MIRRDNVLWFHRGFVVDDFIPGQNKLVRVWFLLFSIETSSKVMSHGRPSIRTDNVGHHSFYWMSLPYQVIHPPDLHCGLVLIGFDPCQPGTSSLFILCSDNITRKDHTLRDNLIACTSLIISHFITVIESYVTCFTNCKKKHEFPYNRSS